MRASRRGYSRLVETQVVVALVGVAGTIGAALLTFAGTRRRYRGEIERLKHERDDERERQLESAQIGYRKLYEKLIKNFEEAERTGQGLDLLHDNHIEAQLVGFKPVSTALDIFWPEERRIARELPHRDEVGPLLEAMRMHGSIRLKDLDEMRRRGEA